MMTHEWLIYDDTTHMLGIDNVDVSQTNRGGDPRRRDDAEIPREVRRQVSKLGAIGGCA